MSVIDNGTSIKSALRSVETNNIRRQWHRASMRMLEVEAYSKRREKKGRFALFFRVETRLSIFGDALYEAVDFRKLQDMYGEKLVHFSIVNLNMKKYLDFAISEKRCQLRSGGNIALPMVRSTPAPFLR